MGIFSAPNPLEPFVDKATDEKNTNENWALIMEVCDRAAADPKDGLRAIVKRLNHANPHVVMQAITLLDACVNNSGKNFHLEVCSRDFMNELRRLNTKSHPKTAEKIRLSIKRWSEQEFKNDTQLSLIPALYHELKKEGYSFKSSDPTAGGNRRQSAASQAQQAAMLKNPNYVGSAQEEEDIAKAIELSLKENKGGGGGGSRSQVNGNNSAARSNSFSAASPSHSSGNSSNRNSLSNGPAGSMSNGNASNGMGGSQQLYPTFSAMNGTGSSGPSAGASSILDTVPPAPGQKDTYKVRALYDFEAAEDNELTFKAGEVIIVSDDSDPNWWKGSNHRGEGLFPANFVTPDMEADWGEESEPERALRAIEKRVSFSEDVKVKVLEQTKEEPVEIDEQKIDRMLHVMYEADPTGERGDNEEMIQLEEICTAMGPLIDEKLEEIDAKHAALTGVLAHLNTALAQYHELMRESGHAPMAAAAGYPPPQQIPPSSVPTSIPMTQGGYAYPGYNMGPTGGQMPMQQQQQQQPPPHMPQYVPPPQSQAMPQTPPHMSYQHQQPHQQQPQMMMTQNGQMMMMPPQGHNPGQQQHPQNVGTATQVTYTHQPPPQQHPQQQPQSPHHHQSPHMMPYQQPVTSMVGPGPGQGPGMPPPQQQHQQQQPMNLGPAPPTTPPGQDQSYMQQQQTGYQTMSPHHQHQQQQQQST